MKHSTALRRMVFLLLAASALMFVSCAGMEFYPKHSTWYYHKELPEADRAIAAARATGKDKECPEEFAAAAKMRDDAYDTYWACFTKEGIEMAKKATAMANALCPAKPVAKAETPPPPPPPAAEPPKAEEQSREIAVIKIVNFDFDKYSIKMMYKPELDMAASIIKKYPDANILIEGHTDSKGTAAYNMRLSLRRADAVKHYLVVKGVGAERIKVEGYGFTRPVAPNKLPNGKDNPAGRAKNRRAEIHIMGK
ncbi:MAG: OmpA family protein [Nitrospirae bacterium]|nr:OmpA family protein [Nitrospirota bacterium]